MRKSIIMAMAALAFGTQYANAQNIKAEKEIVNVGRVAYKSPVTATFTITNNGKNELHINDVRTNCGCVAAKLKHKRLAKGKSMTIDATYDSKQLGHFEKVIALYTDEDSKPFMLVMKGVVVADTEDFDGIYNYKLGELDVDHTTIEFDDVNRGDRPKQFIHIKNTTDKEVEPVIMHLPPYLSAKVSPQKIAPGRSGVATITLDSWDMHDYGLNQTTIYLGSFPGDKVADDKSIEVSTVLLPEQQNPTEEEISKSPIISVAPADLELGTFGKKSKKSGAVYLKNTGKGTLEIQSIQVFTAGLDVSLSSKKIAPEEVATIRVTAHKEFLQKVRTQPRILMITNDPKNPKVVIHVNVK